MCVNWGGRTGIKKEVPALGLGLRHGRGGVRGSRQLWEITETQFSVSRPSSVGSAEQAPARQFGDEGEARRWRREGPKRERSGIF